MNLKIYAIQRSMYSYESDDEGGSISSYAGTAVDHDHLYLTREAAEAALQRLTAKPEPQATEEKPLKYASAEEWLNSDESETEPVEEGPGDESSYDDDDYNDPDYTIVELEVKE